MNILISSEQSGSGLGAFGINLKSFLFQLITFLLVVIILRRYVFPSLIGTLEKRRATLERSLVQAKKTEEALVSAEAKVESLIKAARGDADKTIAEAGRKAQEIVAAAEGRGAEKAARIVKTAEEQLAQERDKLRSELKAELVDLVATATEKVISEKMTGSADLEIIRRSIKELSR